MVGGRMALGLVFMMGVGLTSACGPAEPTAAVVAGLVDGDTIDVTIDGRAERIRLLNIDAPEVGEPDVECLGP